MLFNATANLDMYALFKLLRTVSNISIYYSTILTMYYRKYHGKHGESGEVDLVHAAPSLPSFLLSTYGVDDSDVENHAP